MDYVKARATVAQLFEHDLEKAQDILARCCENQKVYDEIFFFVSKLGASPHQPAGRGSYESSVAPSLHESHHSISHIHQQEIPLRPLPGYLPTPARTARSEVSHSTKGDTGHKEYIYLLNTAGDTVEEQLVRMKIAPIPHSVIRYDLVSKEELDANTVSAEEGVVQIPLDADAGTTIVVPYRCVVKLTWVRRKSGRTHSTKFYVVDEKTLDDDMIISYADAGVEYPTPDVPPLHPETRHFQGYTSELQPSGLQPLGRSPPSASYHRSAETNNDSLRALSAQYQTQHNYQHHHTPAIPEVMSSAPSAPGGSMENHRYSQNMPSSAFLGSQPTQQGTSQPNPYRATVTTAASTSAVSANQRDVSSEKLRISIKWGETRFGIWLYPDAPGEDFFEAFQDQARKRKKSLDRATTSILLKEDEEAPDDKSNELFLDEDSLKADWSSIVKWIAKHKKSESPHIFGTVM